MTYQKSGLSSTNGADHDYSKILNNILARAWVDSEFRENLLAQTPTTLKKHGLPPKLVNGLPSDGRDCLESLARQLLLVFDGHDPDTLFE